MNNISQEQLKKRFQLLPESLQIAIFSEQSAAVIRKSCNLRDISVYQIPIVAILTGRVLLGYLRPENFAAEIQKETGIEMTKAQLIAHDIDTEVFSNVRLELKKLYPPIIQTPNIQRPVFGQSQSPKNQRPATSDQRPKLKYVIPIPEKFMKREAWSIKPETHSQYGETRLPTTGSINESETNQPQITPQINKSQKVDVGSQKPTGGGLTSAEPSQPTQAQQKPEIPKPQSADSELQANFKPVVPLPTFIRSQFKAEEPPKTADTEKQKAEAKAFAGKFSAPDPTVAKPLSLKEDQYREKI